MAKYASKFTPCIKDFNAKIREAIKSEDKDKKIKKAVDDFLTDLELTIPEFKMMRK